MDTGGQLAVSGTVGVVINLCNKCLLSGCQVLAVLYSYTSDLPICDVCIAIIWSLYIKIWQESSPLELNTLLHSVNIL